MAMLAEQKKKKKWSLNPRGTLWSNDENKFGQKLLEKMGWAKGKGLGKKEQGCQEPIKLSENIDQKGLGYKECGSSDWTKHCEAFEDVLSNLESFNAPDLNEQNSEESEELKSLEEKSKGSRARVHYQKFTRGKDLSQYKEDDLACVLGSKRAKRNTDSEEVESNEMEIGQVNQSDGGLVTIHGGNLKDYFTQKMGELKKKRQESLIGCHDASTLDGTIPNLEFEPEKMSFSFNVSNTTIDKSSIENTPGKGEMEQKESDSSEVKTRKKKKKNKHKKLTEECENGSGINADDVVNCDLESNDNKLGDNEINIFIEKKIKKKKRNSNECVDIITEKNASQLKVDVNLPEETKIKRKKKKFSAEYNTLETENKNPPLLNDSYFLATDNTSDCKNKLNEKRTTLKDIKKKTSELKLTEMFISTSNLNPDDQELPDKKVKDTKTKLSAKKSFKVFKGEIEEKLKVMKRKYSELEILNSVKPIVDHDKQIEELENCQKKKRKRKSELLMDDDSNDSEPFSQPAINDLYPGSNLAEIEGYYL